MIEMVKPALVLDLVEEFRVPVIDSVLFPLFIEKKLNKQKYFEKIATGQYQLSSEGKSVVVSAVMKRLNEEMKWRGKKYTQKQIIENQIRAMGRHFVEKEDRYTAFRADKLLAIK